MSVLVIAAIIGATTGFIVGGAPFGPTLAVGALVAGLFQFGGDLYPMLGIVAVFMVGQALEGMVLTPLLVGDRIGLHPVAVIFAILAGGELFGFTGVMLALPVAAVIAESDMLTMKGPKAAIAAVQPITPALWGGLKMIGIWRKVLALPMPEKKKIPSMAAT